MLNRLVIILLVTILSYGCSKNICGVYSYSKDKVVYNLALKCDSTFVFKKITEPVELSVSGKWQIDNNLLIFNESIEDTSGINLKISQDTLSDTEISILPVRKKQWQLNLSDFDWFKVLDKNSIEFKHADSTILLNRE